jgi:hypothetical protein
MHEIPAIPMMVSRCLDVGVRAHTRTRRRSVGSALPDHRASFGLLETQRHIRAILLRPDNQGL